MNYNIKNGILEMKGFMEVETLRDWIRDYGLLDEIEVINL